MDFSNIKEWTIPEGEAVKIMCGENVLWEKVVESGYAKTWNLKDRIEFVGANLSGATVYCDPNGTYTSNKSMPLDDTLYWNRGRHINNGLYYSDASSMAGANCTLSNVTENSLSYKAGNNTELFIAVPFHLDAGETFNLTYYASGTNRSGYQIFNTDGTFRSYKLDNQSGAGNKTFTYTATDECWIAWMIGKYDASATLNLSNIVLTIS